MNQIRPRHVPRRPACLWVVGALLIALPAALLAQPEGAGVDQALATATVYSGGLAMQPDYAYSYSQAIVTLSGGEVFVTQTFEPGESISVELLDLQGEALPDGTYSWELQLIPDQAAARELRMAATEAGGEAPDAWTRQTGSLTILGGLAVSPDLTEFGGDARGSGLEPQSRFGREVTSPSFARSAPVADDDASVGFRDEAEAEARAEAAKATPIGPPAGAMNFERSDEATLAAGQSLEPTAMAPSGLSGEAKPAPRSISPDGKNGRPRSRDEAR